MIIRLKIIPFSAFLLFLFVTITEIAGAEFIVGSADVSFSSQLSTGSSWRLDDADLHLVTSGNAMGLGSASSGTSDECTLNFEIGDIYSLIIKDIHDFEISKDDSGVFLRVNYLRDQELEDGKWPRGNLLNAYSPRQSLNDSKFAGYSTPAGFPAAIVIDAANSNAASCALDSFVMDSSRGYRIRAELAYNSAITGINLTLSLAWSHDVDGYSPDTNFLGKRKGLSLALGGEYLNKHSGSVAYTSFSGSNYNTQIDRTLSV